MTLVPSPPEGDVRHEDTQHEGELAERVFRTELELREWRARARSAERRLAYFTALQSRPAWRIFMAVLELRTKVAPPGSRRDAGVRRLARSLRSERQQPRARPIALPHQRAILFVSGRPGATQRYRCDHRAEQLGFVGTSVDVADLDEVDLVAAVAHYRCFVLHRVPYSPAIVDFLAAAAERGTPVLFDTDDLIFDPELADLLPAPARQDDGVARQRATLAAADAVTVTTQPLAERAANFNPAVRVWPNVVGERMVELSGNAVTRRESDHVTIGYLSGTATHDRDFLEAADAVLWALETYAFVRFSAIGKLTLDSRFDRFAGRVARLPFVPWTELPSVIRELDVNLAPLERDNPYCDSKSAVKYLEAALLGVPTIASPRWDFARTIDHGRNGLLAESREEWRAAVAELCESAPRRSELGRAAFDDVRARHTSRVTARDARATIADVLGRPSDRPLTIRWLSTAAEDGCAAIRDALAGRAERLLRAGAEPRAIVDVVVATDPASAFAAATDETALFRCRLLDADTASLSDDEARLPLLHVAIGREAADTLERATLRPVEAVNGAAADADAVAQELDRLLRAECYLRIGGNG